MSGAKIRGLTRRLPVWSSQSNNPVPLRWNWDGHVLQKLSLPVRLALLVAGTTLPLIVFAVGIVVYNYKQDRDDEQSARGRRFLGGTSKLSADTGGLT